MFVCWGPVSLTGQEIGWSRGAPRGHGFLRLEGQGPTPADVYDNLYKQWKPDKFDARQWVRIAQEAGQKYMIFLVKHHDGFCLYDSKLTDYKTTGPESAWKHDVMADMAQACQEAGLKLIIYYSQPDWHHPDYGTENHPRYIEYLHGQIRELLTNYGRIDGFWFDLGGKPEHWDSVKLFRMMRDAAAGVDHQQPLRPAGRFRHAGTAAGLVPAGSALGNLHDLGHAVVVEAGGRGQVAETLHRRAGDVCGPQWEPGAEHQPHAGRPDRTSSGGTVPGDRPVAESSTARASTARAADRSWAWIA